MKDNKNDNKVLKVVKPKFRILIMQGETFSNTDLEIFKKNKTYIRWINETNVCKRVSKQTRQNNYIIPLNKQAKIKIIEDDNPTTLEI